jgi:hypothetical protein
MLTLCAAGLAACSPADGTHVPSSFSADVPDQPPPGFATVDLIPGPHAPVPADAGVNIPSGAVWYRAIDAGATDYSATLEWYVRAQHLRANWVYRIELGVGNDVVYSIASTRTDATGSLANHGALTRLADQFCVGTTATPQPFAANLVVTFSVKADGSGSGPVAVSGPFIGETKSLPCGGNGDNRFDIWLVSRQPVSMAAAIVKGA